MGIATGWLWVVLAMASATPPAPSAEAVCGLSALHTAEQAFFGEKDRYDRPAVVGFLPLPCSDGTRPPAPESHSVGGCQFIFTVREAGSGTDAAFTLEARGVTPNTRDLRFLLDGRDGVITHAGSNTRAAPVDCEAWAKTADPLFRYHAIGREFDCLGGPYAPEHPCTEALTQLVDLTREGVGVARMEYAAHPTARELYPLSPPTPAMLLCGVTATPQQRAQLVDRLSRQQQLRDAVLVPYCHPEGLRVALPRLLQGGACPGPQCLALMSRAQNIRLPERLGILEGRAEPLARWLWDQPTAVQRDFLSQAADLPAQRVDALLRLRKGEWPSLQTLQEGSFTPLENAWFDQVRREHPALFPLRDIVLEIREEGSASPAAFKRWSEGTPCFELVHVTDLAMTAERLHALANAEARCPGEAIPILSRHLRRLPSTELMRVLDPLPPAHLHMLRDELSLYLPARAEALFDWVMERDIGLLDGMTATPAIVTKLLSPSHVNRLGGREAVLDLLLGSRRSPRITLTDAALLLVMTEALKGAPSAARVRNVSEKSLNPVQKQLLLSDALRARDSRIQAAAAAGFAAWNDATSIPAPAAQACLAEARDTLACLETQSKGLGPPPPGPRPLTPGAPSTVLPTPIEAWCTRFDEHVATCPTACGGALPGPSVLARLASIAGEPPPTPPDGLRACTLAQP
ncbi:hypothetical protein [Corallococcus sp. M7]